MVRQKNLQMESKTMSAAAFVDRARGMARFLEDREAHALGDREMARDRIERRYGIAGSVLYSLRYRPPKTIAADIYARLCAAVEDAGARHMRTLEDEIAEALEGNSEVHRDRADQAMAVLSKVRTWE
jgi:hypothetical protein